MGNKMQLECMDNECRTVMFGHFSDGMSCVRCGGPVRLRPYNPVKKQTAQSKNMGLTIQLNTDTTEALQQMKEVTEVANECVAALEKLEKVMGSLKGKSEPKGIKGITVEISTVLNGQTLASDIVKSINDINSNIRI